MVPFWVVKLLAFFILFFTSALGLIRRFFAHVLLAHSLDILVSLRDRRTSCGRTLVELLSLLLLFVLLCELLVAFDRCLCGARIDLGIALEQIPACLRRSFPHLCCVPPLSSS